MPTTINLHIIEADGRRHDLSVPTGQSLMRAAVAADVDAIKADCGGTLTCATCHVFVDEAWFGALTPADADEDAMLEMTAAERQPNSRLSCQVQLTAAMDGLVVTVPDTQY
jgi:2Fe-2S ferredoxin